MINQSVDAKTGEVVRAEKTNADYEQVKIDWTNDRWNKQQFGYIDDRQRSYISIGDQLDQLYWDIDSGKLDKTGVWYKAIKKVKTDNPKPS
jgi:hypothetical protein